MRKAEVIITHEGSNDIHVGIYEDGEQEGGSYVNAEDGVIRLTVRDVNGGERTHYIDIYNLSVSSPM